MLYDPTRFIKDPANGATVNPIPCGVGTYLNGSSKNGHWGYWYDGIAPAMVITNGTNITVEMPTFGSSVAWEHMGEGDPGMEDLYGWTEDGPNVAFKGPNGTTNSHFMNGPIYVCGAEPGDVLQVDIVDLRTRPNPGKNNESWGFTANYGIGWTGYATPGFNASNMNQAVVFKAVKDNTTGRALWWEPEYTYNTADPRITAVTSCVPETAEMLYTTDAGAAYYNNTNWPMFGGVEVPCIDGNMTFIVPDELRSYAIKGKYRLPINMHIGNMGLAPALGAATSTAPPYRTGGNLDNRRIGIGATMYYPVEVAGGLLSMGDCHGHQGDGETAATGIETSLDGDFTVTLHKAGSLPKKLELLDYPLLENANEYIIHGFAYRDWAREIENPQINVGAYGPVGGVDLNRAMSVVYNETRDFLINMWFFDPVMWETQPYYQALVMDGTSRTSYP
ncbi:hypothetical protein WJX73_007705 [Symbiochloris irregularis]|uniref:Acetamidase n=1 Tax=Symbiochloris irregularis TaxID=706552 RepID=A0AAW1NMB9_9CHLO